MRALAAAGWSLGLTLVTLLGLQVGWALPTGLVYPLGGAPMLGFLLLGASLYCFAVGEPRQGDASRGVVLALAVAAVGVLLSAMGTAFLPR